eukprot:6459531-Amphidinium_carterae.1
MSTCGQKVVLEAQRQIATAICHAGASAVGEEFLLSYFAKWLRENRRTEQHVNHALAVLRAGG